ncbi:unnamed protein product [Rotaria magnacalcarata]
MSKRQKDISTYFVSNKRRKGDEDKNNSQLSTTNNFSGTECNNESDIVNNKEVSVAASPLFVDQISNNIINLPVPVDDDDIGVYCRYCVLFSRQGNNQALGQFINKPLRSLEDASNYISTHDKCDCHQLSVTRATECVQRYSNTNSDVNVLLNDINVQQENEKRIILASIIKCILFLSKQNIAFRGNDDDGQPNDENANPEIFLGFVALSNTTAVGIAETIVAFIKKCGLRIENIRGTLPILIRAVYRFCPFLGQGYDGANVVTGKVGDVQKLIRDISPRAIYVHCSNHSLDLVLAKACSLQVIKVFFGVVKAIITFINGSPKRKTMLAKTIESTNNEIKRRHLVKLCETRWVEKQSSVIVFKQVYFGIVIALDYLIENGDSETSGLARSYEKSITDIDFAIPLIIVNRVFCITKPYAEQLQKPTCDLVKCYQSIEQVSIYLAELIYDDSQLNELYNEFNEFVELYEIDVCLSRTASRQYQTVENYFTELYKTFINMVIDELGSRFNEHQKIAVNIAKLIPSFIVDTKFSDVSAMFNHYKDDLQSADSSTHKAEFDTWKFSILKTQEDKRPATINETLKMIQPIKLFYPNIYILFQLYALIPVSIAGAERSFSTLKLIKTKLRNRTGDERLSDLAVINIHKSAAEKLNVDSIIDEFTRSKRKINFTNESI